MTAEGMARAIPPWEVLLTWPAPGQQGAFTKSTI